MTRSQTRREARAGQWSRANVRLSILTDTRLGPMSCCQPIANLSCRERSSRRASVRVNYGSMHWRSPLRQPGGSRSVLTDDTRGSPSCFRHAKTALAKYFHFKKLPCPHWSRHRLPNETCEDLSGPVSHSSLDRGKLDQP
jgi:hypothetical protein